jgi:thiosulfate dehydrogenase
MSKFIFGFIIGVLILPMIAFAYIKAGLLPIGANDAPLPFETEFAGRAVHRRINRVAPKRDISEFKPTDYATGAEVYRKDCAFCHGLPQEDPRAVGGGMFPHAPQLFTSEGTVTDDPVGVSYWKVKNGIRLSGMPSFEASLSDQQMWDVAAVVTQADKLAPEALGELKEAVAGEPPSAGTSGLPAAPKK